LPQRPQACTGGASLDGYQTPTKAATKITTAEAVAAFVATKSHAFCRCELCHIIIGVS